MDDTVCHTHARSHQEQRILGLVFSFFLHCMLPTPPAWFFCLLSQCSRLPFAFRYGLSNFRSNCLDVWAHLCCLRRSLPYRRCSGKLWWPTLLDGHADFVRRVNLMSADLRQNGVSPFLLSSPLASFCSRSVPYPARPPLNRLAGSWGDWRKRPDASMLSLWFGPIGRDSRYLPAPRRSPSSRPPPSHHPRPLSSLLTICACVQGASLCPVLSSHFENNKTGYTDVTTGDNCFWEEMAGPDPNLTVIGGWGSRFLNCIFFHCFLFCIFLLLLCD